MPNTDPVNDNPAVTSSIIEQARLAGLANVFPVGAITKGSKGAELAEMGEMKRAGIVAVTDDGRPVPSTGLMRRAMEYARGFDLTVMDHCEDRSLSAGGVMHEGEWSLRLGLRGAPALAEESDAARDCALAELTGARVHLAHVSTRGAVEAVRRAKEKGVDVTCEVAPHHFTLTDEACEAYDTNTKMNPPLRSREHLEAVVEAVADGTIDAIATDHAPHHADEKALEFDHAPFGITGLETAVGLALDRLVHGGHLDLARLVETVLRQPRAHLPARGARHAPHRRLGRRDDSRHGLEVDVRRRALQVEEPQHALRRLDVPGRGGRHHRRRSRRVQKRAGRGRRQ